MRDNRKDMDQTEGREKCMVITEKEDKGRRLKLKWREGRGRKGMKKEIEIGRGKKERKSGRERKEKERKGNREN